jgi:hypothetical protein
MAQIIFIILIIVCLFGVYRLFFTDVSKRNYKIGFIPGPRNLNAYIWTQRILMLFVLLLLIYFLIETLL